MSNLNNLLSKVIIFGAGAGIGSLVTWKLVKTKYERIAQEEIDSVKEVYSKKKPTIDECIEQIVEESEKPQQGKSINDKPDIMEYAKTIKSLHYTSDDDEEEEDEEMVQDKPYVISPDEFDEIGYEIETLTYYADGVLTDYYDEIIDDVDDVVGVESLNHFGENEGDEDAVYVRNDSREHDYEILRDTRNYHDIHSESTED